MRCAVGRRQSQWPLPGEGWPQFGDCPETFVNRIPIFDLDGTLVDSDEALIGAFVALGVKRQDVTFGHVIADECARLGISLDEYIVHYDPAMAHPFPGIDDMLRELGRWTICSNKHVESGYAELERLGWNPTLSTFSDAFTGAKDLRPTLDALDLEPADVIFVGDTAHDRDCAHQAGVTFVLAGWNSRVVSAPGDVVASHPSDVLSLLT